MEFNEVEFPLYGIQKNRQLNADWERKMSKELYPDLSQFSIYSSISRRCDGTTFEVRQLNAGGERKMSEELYPDLSQFSIYSSISRRCDSTTFEVLIH